MNVYNEPRRKREGRARERHAARQRRRGEMAVQHSEETPPPRSRLARVGDFAVRVLQMLWWNIRHRPRIAQAAVIIFGSLFLLFAASYVLGGRVFPNVWVLNTDIGGMTADEAQAALQRTWESMRITLFVEGDDSLSATPAEMGLVFDVEQTFANARSVGFAGIPMGYGVAPVVTVDYVAAQNFFLNLTNTVEQIPYNAGYQWQNTQLIGVPGRSGRALDITLTLQHLQQDPASIVQRRRFDLIMAALDPDVVDPEPYLEQAQAFLSQSFTMVGYDPYRHQTISWSTSPEEIASWLEAGPAGLALRQDTFWGFIDDLNATLNPPGTLEERYLDPVETMDIVQDAVNGGVASVNLRIHYRPTVYEVVAGDTGFRIARRVGLPYALIEQANAGRDLNLLAPGDRLNIPSRDETVPLPPVPDKRIIVDLDTQTLIAYENDVPVFNWLISSGITEAPTYPGVFQILTHEEIASGSSYTLCSDFACGQWQMYWFMGVYEVVPGLMNGFHGAVLLPNGTYLGGGNVGFPYTFGCIMSENSNAEQLYAWAEIGTVVEIISSEYAPQSDLARAWVNGG